MRRQITSKILLVCYLILFILPLLVSIMPQVKADPDPFGVTSDATYWYIDSANLKLYIRKSDGLMQYFVGGSNWTSTKGFGGFCVKKCGVGYNDGNINSVFFPNANPLTQLSVNSTHLSYRQVKVAAPTLRLYVDIQAKAESIEVLYKVENLDTVVRGYEVQIVMWIYQSSMKMLIPNNSILEQNRVTSFESPDFTGQIEYRKIPLYAVSNTTSSVVLVQHPFYNAPLREGGIRDDATRQAFYFGNNAMRAMPNANTTRSGSILYAANGNNYYAANKMPSILATYVTFTSLSKENWYIFTSPIDLPSQDNDTLFEHLQERNINNVEVQFVAGATFTTQRNPGGLTHTNTQITAFLAHLKSHGFKIWWHLWTNVASDRTDLMNLYSNALVKNSTQQNVTDGTLTVFNPNVAYSWGTQILSDVDWTISTFGSYLTGFFIDDLNGNYRLDYNINHSPVLYDPNVSTRNATLISIGYSNLLQQLRTRNYPLIGNAPTHIEVAYYLDAVVLWDGPIAENVITTTLVYSSYCWLLPKGYLRTAICSNVLAINNTNNEKYYRLSYYLNSQPFVFGYVQNPTIYTDKTTYHIQNSWFLQQPAEYAYGNAQILKIQNSDTRLAIFGQATSGTITSDIDLDIYTRSGTLIATGTKSQSVTAYLTGTQDIFVIKQSQTNPYISFSQASSIAGESYASDRLSFTVTAPSGSTSTTKVYAGSKGQPKTVSGATSWSYDDSSKILTLNVTHASPARILISWKLLGDIDGDNDVDVNDLYLLSVAYGSQVGDPSYNSNRDIDCDGDIDADDLYIFAENYGKHSAYTSQCKSTFKRANSIRKQCKTWLKKGW